jgi:small-conductance mechanosensitive channel
MSFTPPIALIVLLAARIWTDDLLSGYVNSNGISAIDRALTVALVVVGALLVDGLVRFFYWHRYWRHHRGRETPALIRDLLTIAIVVMALSIGLWWQEGFSFTGLITASGATAVILGIALQTVIQDLFSGLSINLEGSYAIGDWLTIYSEHAEPTYGRVTGITWRATFLTLEDGRQLMVPNHIVTSNPVLNHSNPRDGKRLSVELSVDTRISCDRVIDMLLGEAMKVSRLDTMMARPAPSVVVDRVSADAIFYQVRFYIDPDTIMPNTAKSMMYRALLDVIQQKSIPRPVTQIEMATPADLPVILSEKEVRESLRHAAPFQDVLDEAQADFLANRCEIVQFSQDALLMRQGDPASSMFIILEGAAAITIDAGTGERREVAVLASGDIMGEMSLMTGAPRSATVTALTRLRALEVTKASVEELFQKSPELLLRFSQMLTKRQGQLKDHTHRTMIKAPDATDLLNRMKIFFNLGIR